VLFATVAYPPELKTKFAVVSLRINYILYFLTIGVSIYLIFSPMNFIPYIFMCLVWGLLNIIDGGSISGVLMVFLGCAFAYRLGFFNTHYKRRLALVLSILFLGVLSQYRFGFAQLVSTFLNLLEFSMVFGIIFFLFIDKIRGNYISLVDSKIYLDSFGLNLDEIEILRCVIQGTTYRSIALSRNISESLVKQKMSAIFKKIGVRDKSSLISLYKDGRLIIPHK
jgi:DNA-binding CsgD family transcriptional regulator